MNVSFMSCVITLFLYAILDMLELIHVIFIGKISDKNERNYS